MGEVFPSLEPFPGSENDQPYLKDLEEEEEARKNGHSGDESEKFPTLTKNKRLSLPPKPTQELKRIPKPPRNPPPNEPPKNPWGDNSRKSMEPGTKRTSNNWLKGKEEIIGFYVAGKTIGSGGVGTVRKAKHIETGEKFAIKSIKMDEKKVKFIKREIAISRLLNHPNVIKMYDVIYEDFNKQVYMVFDLVNGGALLDYIISHTHLSEKIARPFFRQILSAVAYCHSNCIVHRDLKIENILIDKTGQVKIIDFGLANIFDPKEFLTTNCGSIYFAAPELLHKYPYQGPEVDVWSLGVILYVMLTGRVPFEDKILGRLYEKIKKGDLRFPHEPSMSKEARSLIQQMLTVDRGKRASLNDVLNHPWVNNGYSQIPKDENPQRVPFTLIDPEIVEKMSEFGYPEKKIYQTLRHCLDNQVSMDELIPIRSLYYLIQEKLERDKKQTIEIQQLPPSELSPREEQKTKPERRPKRHTISIPRSEKIMENEVFNVLSVETKKKELPVTPPTEEDDEFRPRSRSLATFAKKLGKRKGQGTPSSPTNSHSPSNSNTLFPPQSEKFMSHSNSNSSTFSHNSDQESSQSSITISVTTPTSSKSVTINTQQATESTHSTPKSRPRSSTFSSIRNAIKSKPKDIEVEVNPQKNDQDSSQLNTESSSSATNSILSIPSPKSSDTRQHSPQRDDLKQLKVKGLLSVLTTSTKPPFIIKDEIERVLGNHKIAFITNGFTLLCTYILPKTDSDIPLENDEIKLEISIVKVQLLNIHGIRMKRISGDAWEYKNVCTLILKAIKI